jgi:hypothetical protein
VARPRKNPLQPVEAVAVPEVEAVQPVEAVAVPEVEAVQPVEAVAGGDAVAPKPGKTPKALRVLSLYAYWGNDGNLRRWAEGAQVTEPAEIADLIARGAPVEEV